MSPKVDIKEEFIGRELTPRNLQFVFGVLRVLGEEQTVFIFQGQFEITCHSVRADSSQNLFSSRMRLSLISGSFFAPRVTIVLGCILSAAEAQNSFSRIGSPTSHCKTMDLEGRCWKLFAYQPFRSLGSGEFSTARTCPGSCRSEQKGYEFLHFGRPFGSVLARFQVERCHFKAPVLAMRPPKTNKRAT